MSIQPSQLNADTKEFQAELDSRVASVLEKDGYTKPDRDGLPQQENSLVRVALATHLGKYSVASKKARYDDAGRLFAVINDMFPDAPGPSVYDEYEDEDARLFAAAVWARIVQLVNAQLRTVAMETLVEEMYGKTICRVVLHPNDEATQFIYITDDIGCILQDYSGPRNSAIRRAQEAMVKALRPVIKRHPQHGKRLISEFKKVNGKLLETSTEQLQLALEMSPNGDGADGEDEDE